MCLRNGTLILIFFGLFLLFGYVHSRHIPTYAGSYRIVVNLAHNKSDEYNSTGSLWLQLHSTQVRGRQPQYGWGKFYAAVPITDDMKFEIKMAVRSNNEWKKNAFIFPFSRACSNMLMHGIALVELAYGARYSKCPLPAVGFREMRNRSFDLVFPHFPVMPYGLYLFTLAVSKGDKVLGVGVSEMELVPRI